MIGHHVKQDKISLKILKKIRSILRKFPLSSFLFFINYRTRYSRLFEASKGTSLFSIKVSIKGRWFGRNRAAERRLAAKSNPRWRVEKGRKKKKTRWRRYKKANRVKKLLALSLYFSSPRISEEPFHHFLWKISRERVNGKDCRAKNFSPRSRLCFEIDGAFEGER